MARFEASEYQAKIFDFIANEKGSAIVNAVAGSGKTTTIVESLDRIPVFSRTLFLAFNKSIADELRKRVPSHIDVKTLNAFGYGAWINFTGRKPEIDPQKVRKIAKKICGSDWDEMLDVARLVQLAKTVGIVPRDSAECSGIVEDEEDVWESLVLHYDIALEDKISNLLPMVRDALHANNEDHDLIDFDDQLYLPLIYKAPMRQYNTVFVDEAQDISDIQRELVGRSIDPKNGRLIAVGDPNQAIYGFRGANSNSMSLIARQFDCAQLPLSISYRCPKSVVAAAREYVSHIEPSPTAQAGAVTRMGKYKLDMFKPNDLVICRNAAPIVELAFRLLRNGIGAHLTGRDMGKGLISLIRKQNANGIEDLLVRLGQWKDREIARMKAKDADVDVSRIYDKFEVISTVAIASEETTIDGLIKQIERLFAEGTGVTLSTIHRAKGLEADTVYILDDWLMPSKYAKKGWQMQQEYNLAYVAITRAKKELRYITTKENKSFGRELENRGEF